MEKTLKVGILRETKNPPDRRVPLAPSQIVALEEVYPFVNFFIQPSDYRCYSDADYEYLEIPLKEDLSDCDILMGIKEADRRTLIPGKTYMFFAHVAKKQLHNRDMLRDMAEKRVSLIDYEFLTSEKGERIAAFGRFAGIIGAYNALRARGINTNRFRLKPASQCHDLDEMWAGLKLIELKPGLKILVTGSGRVSGNNNNNNSTPEITTTTPEVVADESAKLGGKLISDGGSYITEKGVYWGASQNPEITGAKVKAGSGSERFTVTVNVLTPNTKYYVKAYIINSLGEFRGMQVSFKTNLYLAGDIAFNNNLSYGSVTDIEGNIYKTVRIGTQTWMAENLKTTLYNDGTPIPNVTDNSAWITIVTPAYCWHNNMIENKNLIGAHYNWYAVNTGKLCPAGWHVPSDNEWKTFTDYLGGLDVTGGKIKETGLVHWEEPNIGATNSSGFTALPAGQRRGDDGTFTGLGLYDGWWSSTEYNSIKSWYRSIATINTEVFRSSGSVNQTGISIRCIKD